MTSYELPESAVVGGVEYGINSDYRAALDMIEVMSDPELAEDERTVLVLSILFPDFDAMPLRDLQEAVDFAYWFIGGGKEPSKAKRPKLMDWSQDFPLVVSPVNRVLGFEVRAVEHLHWWTFLGAYYEIGGDCLFAQVVSVRKKRSQGKKLDKADEQFYRENRELVDFERKVTKAEAEVFDAWTRG